MKMNRTTFFAYVRNAPFGGRLSTAQVDGMTAVLDAWGDHWNTGDVRHLAYGLATDFHETGGTMQPIEENLNYSTEALISKFPNRITKAQAQQYGRNSSHSANQKMIANIIYGGDWGRKNLGNTQPDDGWNMRGRGLAQITGRSNYVKFGIASNPEKALNLTTAVDILFRGIINGTFTGHKLSDYFNATVDDPIGARATVNAKDKAKLIAGYYKSFLDALNKAIETYVNDGRKTDFIAPDVKPQDAKPDDVPPAQSGTAWTAIAAPAATGIAVPLIGGVNNAYALIFALALLALAGLAAFMFFSGRWQINRGKAPGVVA